MRRFSRQRPYFCPASCFPKKENLLITFRAVSSLPITDELSKSDLLVNRLLQLNCDAVQTLSRHNLSLAEVAATSARDAN
jgi:hypothetical protein